MKTLKNIDMLGLMRLKNPIKNILPYLLKNNNFFISRNYKYYESDTLKNISIEREHLYSLINNDYKNNFVVLDYACNFSAQVYYNAILSDETALINKSQMSLNEDIFNLVCLFENNFNNFSHIQKLPQSNKTINFRNIEMDNKTLVYSFVKSLGKSKNAIVTLGLGSIFIGPMFKALYNMDYHVLPFSRYRGNQLDSSHKKILKNKVINILDDSVGSGLTTSDAVCFLSDTCSIGIISAVEYDWYLYDKIAKKESEYIKFNTEHFEPITLLNTRNHRFLEKSIECIKNGDCNSYNKLLTTSEKFNRSLKFSIAFSKKLAKKYLSKERYKQSINFTMKIYKIYKGL